MKALGFNTIKLPFSFDALKANPQGLYGACSSIASNDALKAGLTEGGKGWATLLMLLPGFYVMNCNPKAVATVSLCQLDQQHPQAGLL